MSEEDNIIYNILFETNLDRIKKHLIPLNEITNEFDYYIFMLVSLISLFLILFIFIIISFKNNEDIKKLDRRCGKLKEETKCKYNKKCLLKEVALGTEIKTAIDKCLK